MARVILMALVLFILPFVIYGIWAFIKRTDSETPIFNTAPNFWLAGFGLVAAIIGILSFSSLDRGGVDTVYEPARFEDGKVIPGRTVPRDSATQN